MCCPSRPSAIASAETGPSAAKSASRTSRRAAETRSPSARSMSRTSSMSLKLRGSRCGASVIARPPRSASVRLDAGGPFLFDVAESPDGDGDGPGQDEEGDDEEADL